MQNWFRHSVRNPLLSTAAIALLALAPAAAESGRSTSIIEQYGKLPIHFEPQQGQCGTATGFVARGSGYVICATQSGTALSFRTIHAPRHVLRVHFAGSNNPEPRAVTPLASYSNYLYGSDPSQWRVRVPNYGAVSYTSLYPGIDLIYYGNQRRLEYDLRVAPGADPSTISLQIGGQRSAHIAGDGSLVLQFEDGNVAFHAPVSYQEDGHIRQAVNSRFVMKNDHTIGFAVGAFDHSRTLVIDPVLEYSTFLGGGSEEGAFGVTVDAAGSAYVTGFTKSTDFPITPGAMKDPNIGFTDIFVTKFNPSGSGLVYSTYFGGTGSDQGQAIAVDRTGSVYVGGFTSSTNFPVTSKAVEKTFGGNGSIGFVSKLNPAGTGFVYSTYVGAKSQGTAVNGLALDAAHNVYITGSTFGNFTVTAHAFQKTAPGRGDAFVSKLNPSGSAYVYSTYLGGGFSDTGNGIAVDSSGNAYVTGSAGCNKFPSTSGTYHKSCLSSGGHDTFVVKMNPSGSGLVYGTFLATSGGIGTGIAIDGSRNIYVAGTVNGTLTPTANAAQKSKPGQEDGFVIKLNSTASKAVYATYLGGSDLDFPFGIRVDSAGRAYVAGDTMSVNFPVTSNAFQPALKGPNGSRNGFLVRLSASGSTLNYSTYIGSDFDSIPALAIDGKGAAYLAGQADSAAFPTTAGAYQRSMHGISDAILAKFSF